MIERIRATVAAQPFRDLNGAPFTVTLSAGVVELQPEETLSALWQRVSDKLLGAKCSGRNQVCS